MKHLSSILLICLAACARPDATQSSDAARRAAVCPKAVPSPPNLPHIRPVHLVADFWIAKVPEPHQPLLTHAQILALNEHVRTLSDGDTHVGRFDLFGAAIDSTVLKAKQLRQLDRTAQAGSARERMLLDGRPIAPLIDELRVVISNAVSADSYHLVYRGTAGRCHPTNVGVYEDPGDVGFDYFQCSQLRMGDVVRVLRKSPSYWFVVSEYVEAWVDPDDLGPAVSAERARAILETKAFLVFTADHEPIWSAAEGGEILAVGRLGLHLPLAGPDRGEVAARRWKVRLPTASGSTTGWIDQNAPVTRGYPALTRARLIRRLMKTLNTPYGWGGTADGRDCSRLLMDLFQSFGLRLPRNSAAQAQAGISYVEIAELDDAAKRAAIESAATRGIVLLALPGHIMLYLGRDGDHQYAFHLFHAYRTPCPGGGQTKHIVDRATVSTLDLGTGSQRGGFLERLTRLVIIGGQPNEDQSAP